MLQHEIYMQRCMELALNGLGHTAPNPLVGSVIVCDDRIIAEGYHQRYGGLHAEADALAKVHDKSLLKKSKMYVNLEPCAHFGKTPPCANAIVEHRIPEVVIANRDPFPEVNGRGIEILQQAGIKVVKGILEQEGRALNRRFFTFHEKRRPYIILKWAETADGFIAREDYSSKWISNAYSRLLVHKWRSEEAAILTGTNTVLYDDPQLTVRDMSGRHPLRIAIDRYGRIPAGHRLFNGEAPTIIFTEREGGHAPGAEYIVTGLSSENFLLDVMQHLYGLNIQSLIVEGGSLLLTKFIQAGLWDEARIFRCGTQFYSGIRAPEWPMGPVVSRQDIEGDELLTLRNTAGEAD